MGVAKGGQSQNQSGSYNNTGTSTGTTSGTTSNTVDSTTMPVAPGGWEDFWRSIQPGAEGFTPAQQTAVDWFNTNLGNGDPAQLAGVRSNINQAGDYQLDALKHRTNPTLAALAKLDPAYATPGDVSSGDVAAQQIAAQRGSQFMADYQNPFQKDVVDASLADYDQGAAEARAQLRGANAGAFGNKRFGVAEGQFGADAALGRGQLSSGLRAQGFNTAAGFGMQDANRTLAADQSNQDATLRANMFNSGGQLAADQFNYQGQQARNMFDSNQGLAYNEQRDRLARDYVGTQGASAGVGQAGFGIGQGLAQGLFGAGGAGQDQNLDWLQVANSLFGQQNTGTTTGTNDVTTSGTSTDAGTTSGSSRGKSGGINIPFIGE